MYLSETETLSYEQLLTLYPVTEATVLRANMVTSLDGKIAIDGRSKGLSTSLDRKIFHLLRATAQVILVGSGTAQTENYQPPTLTPELAQVRQQAGLRQPLRIIVATRHQPPAAITATSDGNSLAIFHRRLPEQLNRVELGRILQIDENQPGGILCEGGPTLLGSLLAQGLVDQLCVTIRHLLVGELSPQLVPTQLPTPSDFDLAASITTQQATFLRLSLLD
ncbi:dihydrofolate reductase family protein [Ferrimicrobium sp.]|uniref:dihydrofolate reductase family protein n=1 Tax=Ferrimicrobium sp. TaxID=2926050 RepID=UPI00262C9748|nr:dihydrofolate reductase family protein [Ferrimicrobium sp.]